MCFHFSKCCPVSKVWDVRLTMERSRAIKCPSVQYQLAGSKKVQQALALPGVVERFIKDPDVVKKIRATFAGLYPLEHVRFLPLVERTIFFHDHHWVCAVDCRRAVALCHTQ